jgi:enolase
MKIAQIKAFQILDSRGNPTIECMIKLEDDTQITASVPSGASVGSYEAKELRDGDKNHFSGLGVTKAIGNIELVLAPSLIGKKPDIISMDRAMIECDGTSDKSRLGANAILAVSIAIIRAQASMHHLELFQLINSLWDFEKPTLPRCMFNIVNGGLHAPDGLCFQEFMISPQFSGSIKEHLESADQVYNELKKILHNHGLSTAIGDEGGFVPMFPTRSLENEFMVLDLLQQASDQADLQTIDLALDIAATQLFDQKTNHYKLYQEQLTTQQLIELYEKLCTKYALFSLEDGLDQDDWNGWKLLTDKLGSKIQIVGDDLFVTHIQRIMRGVDKHIANAVLIKPNQIGTVSETIEAIKFCKKHGYKTIISHRSGETNDTFIADLVVGTATGQLKAGAPVRGERVAKYNRLLEIEQILMHGRNDKL